MKWKVKEKEPKDYIRKRFAFLPNKVQGYWLWLEPYYYYCCPPNYVDDSKQKVKFINYSDCLTYLEFDLSRGSTVV